MTNRITERSLFGILALSVALTACSSANSSLRSGTSKGGDNLPNSIGIKRKGNEKVVEYDLNHDKKPDVWEYYVNDKLVRKELDINWDGKIDIVRSYNDAGQLSQEVLDLDFDGRPDQTNFYENGVIVKKERDLNYDGKPDLWIYYEKGKIVRKERDTHGSGKIDYWEYWENNQIDRIGEDLDGDGNVDRWTKNPNADTSPG